LKKLVLKTVAITLASIVLAFAVAFGAACIFAPKFLAKCFDGVGAYSASVFFYEKQYKKSGVIEDLALLVDNVDGEKDAEKAEKYLKLLVTDEWFESFCTLQDGGEATLISTSEYYLGRYAVALVENGKGDEALEFCYSYVRDNGYTKNNPYRILVSDTGDDKEFLATVKASLSKCLHELPLTFESAERLVNDMNQIVLILQ
jgi:hypothetical protein